MIIWPATLPQSPLINGYQSQRRDNVRKFETDDGPAKETRKSTATPKDVSEPYVLNNVQKQTLETFYDVTTRSGTLPFTKKNPETGQLMQYKIAAPPVYVKNGLYWTTTLILEILP